MGKSVQESAEVILGGSSGRVGEVIVGYWVLLLDPPLPEPMLCTHTGKREPEVCA